ncbi:hypothetical protein DUI87_13561 [Hirundo rustica rustica]|uniref:Uncharacterized protein n=1 Tax=Hirundo rustica rustica TaxID=333673 RepID=A0A3M0KEX4_HIRRU|nr:hypothetical protein DUI87_13561 [Hirundo rustica rustica]
MEAATQGGLSSLLRDPETVVDDNGNPLTLEHLMGEGRWADPSDQTSDSPIKALQIAREHAVSAFFGMVPDGPVVPYYKIMQGAKESFTKFVERLTRAIEVQVTEVADMLRVCQLKVPYMQGNDREGKSITPRVSAVSGTQGPTRGPYTFFCETDNGLPYISQKTQQFPCVWGMSHEFAIPHSPTGQAIVNMLMTS